MDFYEKYEKIEKFKDMPEEEIEKEIEKEIDVEKERKIEIESEKEERRVFFEETPNGKSTKKIMDEFGLEATKLEVVHYRDGTLDVRVHVKPKEPLI